MVAAYRRRPELVDSNGDNVVRNCGLHFVSGVENRSIEIDGCGLLC